MSTAYCVTTNAAPMAGKAPIQPLSVAHVWRGQFWPMLGVALLCGSVMAGVVLGCVAMGVG